jgi:hypothetical protein
VLLVGSGWECRRCVLVEFGKRGRGTLPPQKITTSNWGPTAAPAMAPTDRDGISRMFPREVFEGKTGEFLRSLGLSPDMPRNIAQTEDTFATLDARHRSNLENFVDTINRPLEKGFRVKPFLLLPETVWRSEYRNFLCATCRFYPADPANVFFVAATPQTAVAMRLPLQANLSDREAHDVGLHFVGLLGGIYQKMIADGKSEQQVASAIPDTAREITIYMGVKLFDQPHVEQEHNIFGPRFGRDFGKVL